MRRTLVLGLFAAAIVAGSARADLGPRRPGGPGPGPLPPAQQPQPMKFVVEVDDKAKETRLVIPLEALNAGFGIGVPGGGFGFQGGFQGGAGLLGTPPGGGLNLGTPPGGGFQGTPPTKPPNKQSALPLSTIMVALALAMSLAFGGLWFVRRKPGQPGNGLKAMLIAVALLGAGTTAVVWANRAPPFRPPTPPPEEKSNLPQLTSLENVRVEFVNRRGPIRLIVPGGMKDRFAKPAEEKK